LDRVYQNPRESFSHRWRSFDNLELKCNAFHTAVHDQSKNTKERKLNKRAKFFTVLQELSKTKYILKQKLQATWKIREGPNGRDPLPFIPAGFSSR
jgi:hypothetical protein